MHPGENQPERRASSRLGRALDLAVWLVLLTAGAFLLLSLLQPALDPEPSHRRLAWVAFLARVLSFHAGLALLPVALLAGWRRSWAALALALALVLATLGPALWSYRPRGARREAGTTLTLMSVNALFLARGHDALLAEIRRVDPDVLLIQEYTPWLMSGLGDALRERLPHAIESPRTHAYGQAIFSKLELRGAHAAPGPDPLMSGELASRWGEPRVPQLRAWVDFDCAPLAIQNVHFFTPHSGYYVWEQANQARWASEFARGEPSVVVAGDFNAVAGTRTMRILREGGLRDAFADAGRGRGTTWRSLRLAGLVPGIRIDHAMLSGDLVALEAWVGRDVGSDHLPLVVRLARAGAPREGR